MDDIRKCTQTIRKSSVEQTALFRAWGAKNNLTMEKFHEQVKKELEDESQNEGKGG